MSESIINVLIVIINSTESYIAFIVKPNFSIILQNNPLSQIKFSIINNKRIFNIFLNYIFCLFMNNKI